MTDDPDSLVLRYLRRLDEKVDQVNGRLDEMRREQVAFREHLTAIMHTEIAQDSRLDRHEQRPGRLERRADLHDEETS